MAVAKITKLFGERGEVVVRLYDSWSDHMACESLTIKIDALSVPLFVERFERKGQSGAIMRFMDIDTPQRAEILLGREVSGVRCQVSGVRCQVSEKEVTPIYIYSDLVGWRVGFEGRSECGVIVDFVEDDNNPLFIIDVDGREVLIPAVEEFVAEADAKQKNIVFALPEGLLELYLR